MPKYLCQGSYTEKGLNGVLKEGGSKRRAMVEQLVERGPCLCGRTDSAPVAGLALHTVHRSADPRTTRGQP